MIPTAAQSVLGFWLGVYSDLAFGQPRKGWFIKPQSWDDQALIPESHHRSLGPRPRIL
jgi:hypothetical protein